MRRAPRRSAKCRQRESTVVAYAPFGSTKQTRMLAASMPVVIVASGYRIVHDAPHGLHIAPSPAPTRAARAGCLRRAAACGSQIEACAEDSVVTARSSASGGAFGPAHLGADNGAGGRHLARRRAFAVRLNVRAEEEAAGGLKLRGGPLQRASSRCRLARRRVETALKTADCRDDQRKRCMRVRRAGPPPRRAATRGRARRCRRSRPKRCAPNAFGAPSRPTRLERRTDVAYLRAVDVANDDGEAVRREVPGPQLVPVRRRVVHVMPSARASAHDPRARRPATPRGA